MSLRALLPAGPLEAWVWRIVLNAARSEARRPVHAVEYGESAAANGHPERDADLRAAVACLPERQRLAIFLRYYADLDYAAIGEALVDPYEHRFTDLERSACGSSRPPGGGRNVIDLDRASLDLVLPPEPEPAG